MNRRRILQGSVALGTVALSGCLGGIREHFSGDFRRPIPIEVRAETERHFNVHLFGQDVETGRETYSEAFAATPGRTHSPAHLDGIDQRLTVTQFDSDQEEIDVEQVLVTTDTQSISIDLSDDGIDLRITTRERSSNGNETNDTSVSG